jgi:hypothetical protein
VRRCGFVVGVLVAGALAVAVISAGATFRPAVPKGWVLLEIGRDQSDPTVRLTDGGGVVESLQVGLTYGTHRRAKLHCRVQSVDKTGKIPFQSDPTGICAVYFPASKPVTYKPITLVAQPDFRSTLPTWTKISAPLIMGRSCGGAVSEDCPERSVKVHLVPEELNAVFVGFPLRLFRLSVTNTDPGFGEAEDHDRQQATTWSPLDCGLGHKSCITKYEYGTKPVLDALWDTTRSLTVTWGGCDPPQDPLRTNPALCPLTMTRDRHVTISWP